MTLNYNLYKQVVSNVQSDLDKHDKDEWFNYSYSIFKNQELNSLDDFWKIVAFAYCWMPTIPTIHYKKLEGKKDMLFEELKKLANGNADVNWLFETLTPVINNSVVGTSKALHFIAPKIIPIYDSRVIRAWSRLFKADKKLRLQYKEGGDVGKVLFYIERMQHWSANCKKEGHSVTVRDIELVLYYYGGR